MSFIDLDSFKGVSVQLHVLLSSLQRENSCDFLFAELSFHIDNGVFYIRIRIASTRRF